MIPLGVASLFADKAGKYLLIGGAALATFGAGAYSGHRWQAGKVADQKILVVQAQAETAAATKARERAEADYLQLRQQVADAMQAGRDRAIEQEEKHAATLKMVQKDVDLRVAGVLDHTKRMLGSAAARGRRDRPAVVPQVCSERRLDDPAIEYGLIRRIGECVIAEERLAGIQRAIREQ